MPELIITAINHHAANNLTLGTGQDAGEAERGSYRNTFTPFAPMRP